MAKSPTSQKADLAMENRKLRNRLSQKAYRARQCMRIKELEERLDGHPQGENARIKELEEQNQRLRDQLLSCHKKLESLSLSMKALADCAATSLGLESAGLVCNAPSTHQDPDTPPNDDSLLISESIGDDGVGKVELVQQDIAQGRGVPSSPQQMYGDYVDVEQSCRDMPAQSHNLTRSQELAFWRGSSTPKSYDFENMFKDGSSPPTSFSGSNSNFTFQGMSPFSQLPLPSFPGMGGISYANTISDTPLLVKGPYGELHKSNSLFSDHIAVVEHFLKQKWASPKSLVHYGEQELSNSVSFMISIFVCMSWSVMTSWHTYTRAHIPLKRLHTWRLNPTAENYIKVDSWFRPTTTQMTIPHPSIIDWIPWPAMRDKLIIYHAANPHLDEIICEIGDNYVVECDLSDFVANIHRTPGLIGVFDLVRSIAPTATSEPVREDRWSGRYDLDFSHDGSSPAGSIEDIDSVVDVVCSLPAPNLDALFGSKAFALKAFKALRCDKGINLYKLDPDFFKKHPELYDPTSDLMANGIVRLRPPHPGAINPPKLLDSSLLGRYRELATWTDDLLSYQTDVTAAA